MFLNMHANSKPLYVWHNVSFKQFSKLDTIIYLFRSRTLGTELLRKIGVGDRQGFFTRRSGSEPCALKSCATINVLPLQKGKNIQTFPWKFSIDF